MTGKNDWLLIPNLLDEALARTPAPSCGGGFEIWKRDITGIMCWLRYLSRDAEAVNVCTRWSEEPGITPAQRSNNASLFSSTARYVLSLPPDTAKAYAIGLLYRAPGLVDDIQTGRFGAEYQPTAEQLRQQEAQREARQQEFEARQQEQELATQKQRQKAYADAMRIYGKSSADPDAVRATPYWREKEKAAGFPLPVPEGIRCGSPRMFLPVVGPVYWNRSVIVPLHVISEYLQLGHVSIEVICGTANPPASRTGDKRGLKGGLRQGAFFPINLDKARHNLPLVIVEGLMTGIAVSLMTGGKLPIICAMSCEFFSNVIDELQIAYPVSPFYIIGDVGAGHRKAADLATEKGRAEIYAVDLEPCLPEQEGADAFDMLARHGVDNGMVLLRSMFRTARLARGDATVSPSSSVNP